MKNIILTLLVFGAVGLVIAQDLHPRKSSRQLRKPNIRTSNNFDVNRIDCDVENNGMFVSQNVHGRSGLSWPKGNGTQTVYNAGIWLGGKVDGEIRVVAAEYNGEFASGPWGSNHDDPYHKIYKVTRSDLKDPAQNEDFQNWPVELGAPWVDNDNNGQYEPLPYGPDQPEFVGDQVLWMVMNDGADSLHSLFHSDPLGVEIQRTIFGFDRPDVYGDIMFVKDILINKGENIIDSMFVGLWSDPDVIDAGDDFLGSDTSLGLGICYEEDVWGGGAGDFSYGYAVGYDFFQGPIVPAPGETAYSFGDEIPGFKNLNMTSFMAYT